MEAGGLSNASRVLVAASCMATSLSSMRLNMRGSRVPVFFTCLLALAAIGLFSSTKYFDLMQRIWPSASLAPSTSLDSYEMRFRNGFRGSASAAGTEEVKEWVLAPPRAFLFDEVGVNGAVFAPSSRQFYAAYLEAIVLDDGTVVPRTTVPEDRRRRRSLLVHIDNSGASPGFKMAGGCVPQEGFNQALSLAGTAGAKEEHPCLDRDFRCRIVVPVNGWAVTVSATHDLYKQPESVCDTTRRFLDEYTIKSKLFEIHSPSGVKT